jgi:hypothetical protein
VSAASDIRDLSLRSLAAAVVFKPLANLIGVEANEMTHLEIRDAVLLDQTTEVTDAVVEPLR